MVVFVKIGDNGFQTKTPSVRHRDSDVCSDLTFLVIDSKFQATPQFLKIF